MTMYHFNMTENCTSFLIQETQEIKQAQYLLCFLEQTYIIYTLNKTSLPLNTFDIKTELSDYNQAPCKNPTLQVISQQNAKFSTYLIISTQPSSICVFK